MGRGINLFVIAVLFLLTTLVYCSPAFAGDLMIADFENGMRSNLGTDIGTWNSNPLDTSQGCTTEIIPLYGVMGRTDIETHVLKISYDVATTGPAFNGIYIKLNDIDLSAYNEISMLIKGDLEKGFTTKFKVELKNAKGERTACALKGITNDWERLAIPIQEFKALGSIRDWSHMIEIIFTFDDMTVDKKEGAIYVDEIKFDTSGKSK